MLNGIGGKTIAEAKKNISFVEFISWQEYIRLRGTLNIGLRSEYLNARQMVQSSQLAGGKYSMKDALRFHESADDDSAGEVASLEDVLGLMGANKK